MDRGYYDNDRLVKLHSEGVCFIIGAKTTLNFVREAVDRENSSFYEAKSYLRNRGCYQFHCPYTLKTYDKKAPVELFMCRNPVSEMRETDALYNRLDRFEEQWLKGRAKPNDSLLIFYTNPEPGKPLVRDEE